VPSSSHPTRTGHPLLPGEWFVCIGVGILLAPPPPPATILFPVVHPAAVPYYPHDWPTTSGYGRHLAVTATASMAVKEPRLAEILAVKNGTRFSSLYIINLNELFALAPCSTGWPLGEIYFLRVRNSHLLLRTLMCCPGQPIAHRTSAIYSTDFTDCNLQTALALVFV
jgi:hypothetical protein